MLRVVRGHVVVLGVSLLVLLCAGVLLFDGVIFYTHVIRSRGLVTGNEKRIDLSERIVIDTLRIVDDRQNKFDEILNGLDTANGVAAATSSRR